MKKQFFRVKQLADQTFLKADKSDVFNHKELQIADHKVEYLRSTLTNVSKRLPSVQTSEGNVDKRMKKYPEYQLGQALQDQTQRNVESECKLLQYILRECAQVELELAKEQADHEVKVEHMVSAPLQGVIDNDLPNITKHKRNLNKYILDKDSASNRYHASKNGTNKEALKDDMEEADIKVEQHRDALAAEMFNLLRKESELAQYMLQLLKLQRAYHESALKNLEKVIPQLEQRIGDSPVKAVFGVSLEEHLRVTNRKLAFPLEVCICALTEVGLLEEGLFRVVGGASRVKRLKLAIDSGCFSLPLLPEYHDVHVLASTLKSYLRDLPEPLLTYSLYNEWIDSMRPSDEKKRLELVQQTLRKLPQPNKDNLTYLVQFFSQLSKNPENKMSASNIAIVISPNLIWSQNKEMEMHMVHCTSVNMIVELFINKADLLFPDSVNSYLTIAPSDLFMDEQEFTRPVLSNVKLISHDGSEYAASCASDNISQTGDTSSPRPQMRTRKTKLAPTPPVASANVKNEVEFSNERVNVPPSYPSGSTTLNRSHKSKPTSESKAKVLNLEDPSSSPRRQSLVLDPTNAQAVLDSVTITTHTKQPNESPKAALVNLDDTKTAEVTYVLQPAASIQISKAKPIQQISAQTVNIDKITITSNNVHSKANNNQQYVENKLANKPVAAPRSSITCDNQKPPLDGTRSSACKGDNMSKSLNSMDIDGEAVQVRRPSNDNINERPAKPVVPVRPASLKAAPRNVVESVDPALQRTQCSLYSVAHKQQPSFVNLPNKVVVSEKFQAGHDMQMAEKERFLGHQPAEKVSPRASLENKPGDVNFNFSDTIRTRTSSVGSNNRPEIPPKTGLMKSTEKLNSDAAEKFNGNMKTSHMRTQSDGNIVDAVSPVASLIHTPPSPRSLNKPTQPPPPPPVGANRPKSDPDSTDL